MAGKMDFDDTDFGGEPTSVDGMDMGSGLAPQEDMGFDYSDGPSAAPEEDEEDNFAEPAQESVPASSTIGMMMEEETPYQKWEAEHRELLKKKDAEEAEEMDALAQEAMGWMKDFNQKREAAMESRQSSNRSAEERFVKDTEILYSEGESWNRVAGLVDMQANAEQKDVTRLRQVLLHVKAEPPAHMLK